MHVITGVNKDKDDRRNGVGKSTIADAVHFAIFGETIRDVKREHVANHKHPRSCEVSIHLEIKGEQRVDDIKITRQLSPSKCIIQVNGEDKTRDSISNTNSFIYDTLNCSPDIFQNCVIMTVNNTTPFMAKKKGEKRKFIESIFNLEMFSQMVINLRQDFATERQNFEVEKARLEEVAKSSESYKSQKVRFIEDKNNREDKLKTRRDNNKREMSQIVNYFNASNKPVIDVDTAHEKISEFEEKINLCDDKISDFNTIKVQGETNIVHKCNNHKKIGTDHDQCPTCLNVLNDDDRDRIKSRKESIQGEIDDLETQVKSAKSSVAEHLKLKDILQQSIKDVNNQLLQSSEDDTKRAR